MDGARITTFLGLLSLTLTFQTTMECILLNEPLTLLFTITTCLAALSKASPLTEDTIHRAWNVTTLYPPCQWCWASLATICCGDDNSAHLSDVTTTA
jgi:hypothetical protein